MRIPEKLTRLTRQDLVLVGDNLWDPGSGGWVLGGEQRLLKAIGELARREGFRVWAVQPHPEWSSWEDAGISWIGVPPGKRSGWRRWWWNRQVHAHLSPGARVIYSYAELACPRRVPGAVIWQHGVGWDGRSPERQWRSRRQNKAVLGDCGAMVCVDTNFPNVLASSLRHLEELHRKCVYIPNFPSVMPQDPPVHREGKPHVVYVRRFGYGRGTDLMTAVARTLWDEHLDFSMEFVGYSTSGQEEGQIKELLGPELESGACTMHALPFDRVHEAYERASIAVVPTRQGEGTSLACLEAFAFGLPVIATWVGGLPDLVQDGLNGRLVAPTAGNISSALRELIEHPSLRTFLGNQARESAHRFSRSRWEHQVLEVWRQLGWLKSSSGEDV